MAKIIKKKFRDSFPFFMILTLLSMSVVGLVFNFDVGIKQTGDKIGLNIEVPEVEANADVATTTVRIKNSAPTFTTPPAENPASASTSPINVGGSINFTGTAHDNEGNNFYLIICDQAGVTAGAGGSAPTCDHTTFCVSASTTPDSQANCTYSNVADPSAEFQNWVGYACDDHSLEASCSLVGSSPTDETASPFYVNHAPSFTGVATIVDNQVPGGTFTFEATTTDSDIAGGADVLTLDVCSTNAWATSTGCAVTTLCTGTSTSPNVTCDWTTGTPLNDTTYNYFAFVKDWHEMPSAGNSQAGSYTVANAPPSVSSVTLNDGSDITLNIKGNTTAVYASTTSITDPNGCQDIVSATGTIYLSSVTDGMNCDADNNDCYQMDAVSCVLDAASCTGPSDSDISVQCSTDLEYYTIPTVAGSQNPHGADNWLASIKAFDESASYASTSAGVEVAVSTAIEVNQAEIAYGSLVGGTNTGTTNATTTIVNAGNAPLDSDVTGADMLFENTGPSYIPALNQKFDLANFDYNVAGTAIASSSPTPIDTYIPRPVSATDVEDDVYWGISVPTLQSGEYFGLNTFEAVLDDNVGAEW